ELWIARAGAVIVDTSESELDGDEAVRRFIATNLNGPAPEDRESQFPQFPIMATTYGQNVMGWRKYGGKAAEPVSSYLNPVSGFDAEDYTRFVERLNGVESTETRQR